MHVCMSLTATAVPLTDMVESRAPAQCVDHECAEVCLHGFALCNAVSVML